MRHSLKLYRTGTQALRDFRAIPSAGRRSRMSIHKPAGAESFGKTPVLCEGAAEIAF